MFKSNDTLPWLQIYALREYIRLLYIYSDGKISL